MFALTRQARHLRRYRQIVQVLVWHGFGFTVEQLGLFSLLSLPRRILLGSRATTPASVAVRLRLVLTELGPTFVKFGQLLSTRPDVLPASYVEELGKLQDTVPPFPTDIAIQRIEEELGKSLSQLYRSFDYEPLAAASIGQVHTAVMHNGDHVVVKVQRPGITQQVDTDLSILNDLASLAQQRQIFDTQYDLTELAWEFTITLRAELDYRREGANADRFRNNFAGNPTVHVPKVYWEHTSTHVITYERLYGIKINDIAMLDASGLDRKRLARNSLLVIMEEVFKHGFYHSDPHPGNFFALEGEVIGAVDFGQAGVLDQETTRQMLLLLLSVGRSDTDGAIRALQAVGMIPPSSVTPSLRRDVNYMINRYVDRPLDQLSISEVAETLYSVSKRHRLQMPAQLATLLKTFIMIEGTGRLIDPKLDIFALARPYAESAVASQFAPNALLERVTDRLRDLTETSLALPRQLGDILYRLETGTLTVQTREEEMRTLARVVSVAANRLAIGVVLGGLLISLGLAALALDIQHWDNTFLVVVATVGVIAVFVMALAFLISLLRGPDV